MKKSKQTAWRLGGKNAPKWLLAPCIPAVKQRTREDLDLLKEVFRIERLPSTHPLHEVWHRSGDAVALAEARYDLHQLADDVRLVRDVPGGKQLLSTMVNDVEGYEDFRYELRVAGAVGRRPGQTLVAVGGTAKGPDVQVKTLSGHLCGIACYRGRTWTTLLAVEAPEVFAKLVARCSAICTSHVVGPLRRVKMAITFERFPVKPEVVEAAVAAFDEVWNRPEGEPRATRDGVSVSREAVDEEGVTETWEVALALRVPVPERERFRLTSAVRDKLEKEERQWAGSYEGVPILSAEESDFCLGFDQKSFEKELLEETQHSMQGILTSWQFFTDGFVRGSRIRVERYDWHGSKKDPAGLHLGIHTFGENMNSYGDQSVVLIMNPKYADEEWKITGIEGGRAIGTCTRPLNIERRMTRRPALPPGQLYTKADILPMVNAVQGKGGYARVVTGSQRRPR